MSNLFYFGEQVEGYPVRVLNEREVRAGAGILFFFAMISFLNAFLVSNYLLTKVFVIVFFIDFFIRVLINPKFAPSLILGRMLVSNQTVEYVGASQKRFAWAIGLLLGAAMLWLLVLHDIRGPLNLAICTACLLLLFFETAFSICLGCSLHNWITKKEALLCPGDVCVIKQKEPIQRVSGAQLGVFAVFVVFVVFLVNDYRGMRSGHESQLGIAPSQFPNSRLNMPIQGGVISPEDCTPPTWVGLIGREEQWKLHHGCATTN